MELDYPPHKALLAKTLLIWILYVSRPMTMEELQRVVAVDPDTHRFDSSRIVHEGTLLGICRGLVVVEDGSRVARLVRECPFPLPAHAVLIVTADYTAKHLLQRL